MLCIVIHIFKCKTFLVETGKLKNLACLTFSNILSLPSGFLVARAKVPALFPSLARGCFPQSLDKLPLLGNILLEVKLAK